MPTYMVHSFELNTTQWRHCGRESNELLIWDAEFVLYLNVFKCILSSKIFMLYHCNMN